MMGRGFLENLWLIVVAVIVTIIAGDVGFQIVFSSISKDVFFRLIRLRYRHCYLL
jgi:hypothetical protein